MRGKPMERDTAGGASRGCRNRQADRRALAGRTARPRAPGATEHRGGHRRVRERQRLSKPPLDAAAAYGVAGDRSSEIGCRASARPRREKPSRLRAAHAPQRLLAARHDHWQPASAGAGGQVPRYRALATSLRRACGKALARARCLGQRLHSLAAAPARGCQVQVGVALPRPCLIRAKGARQQSRFRFLLPTYGPGRRIRGESTSAKMRRQKPRATASRAQTTRRGSPSRAGNSQVKTRSQEAPMCRSAPPATKKPWPSSRSLRGKPLRAHRSQPAPLRTGRYEG